MNRQQAGRSAVEREVPLGLRLTPSTQPEDAAERPRHANIEIYHGNTEMHGCTLHLLTLEASLLPTNSISGLHS